MSDIVKLTRKEKYDLCMSSTELKSDMSTKDMEFVCVYIDSYHDRSIYKDKDGKYWVKSFYIGE